MKIDQNGTKSWCIPNTMILHREDGPAVEYPGGDKRFYLNGKLHNLKGPAVEYTNGYKSWYLNGKYIDCKSQEEFERLLKLKAFW